MLSLQPLVRLSGLLAVCAMISGCGPKYPETFPVSGTVTLDDKPIAGASVVFTPDEGEKATGTTDNSGRFELSTYRLGDGALPGRHRVTIAKTSVDPDDETKIVFVVPKTYGDLRTSELTCDVHEEMAPISFALQSDREPQPQPKPEAEAEPVPEAPPEKEAKTEGEEKPAAEQEANAPESEAPAPKPPKDPYSR